MVKSLRLSWIGRLLDGTDANWKAIPDFFFIKHGGLAFLLKYNYDITKKELRSEDTLKHFTVGKKMAAVHFTAMLCEPNTAYNAQRKPSFYNICPCAKDTK